MNYAFPINLSFEETLEVILSHNKALGYNAFFINETEDYKVFSYKYRVNGMFPSPNTGDPSTDRFNAILRECRGLTFSKDTGKVVARKYHKFMNLNEEVDTQLGNIDWANPHVILKKMDGSMITSVVKADGSIEYHTRLGLTPISKNIHNFVEAKPNYKLFANWANDNEKTTLFEWCSRKNKIIIDYDVDSLILTAIRDNVTGEYLSVSETERIASQFGIPVVDTIQGSVTDVGGFINKVRGLTNEEGYVCRFDNGHMIKMKGTWYLGLHKVMAGLCNEKDIVVMIIENRLDDVLPYLTDEARTEVERFNSEFFAAINRTISSLRVINDQVKLQIGNDTKKFATEIVPTLNLRSAEKAVLLSMWKGDDGIESVKRILRLYIGSQPRLDSVRYLFDGVSWDGGKFETMVD